MPSPPLGVYKFLVIYATKATVTLAQGGTEGGAGGAIAPPLFQNECGKQSSTAKQNCVNQRSPR